MEKEGEHEWEQEASLTLRRSRFRNGHAAALEFGPSPATSGDAQRIPPQLNSNGNGNSKSNGHIIEPAESAATDQNGIVDHMVALFDQHKIAALTDTWLDKLTDTHSKPDTSVYYDTDEGIALWNSGEEQVKKKHGDGISGGSTGDVSVQKNFDSVLGHQVDGNKKDSKLSLQHSEILSEEYGTTHKSLGKNEIENEDEDEDIYHINEFGLEVKEIDLERVLEKQNTHDLYCPNCNSCITRRVILRKRKRGVRITNEDVKRNKLEIAVDSNFIHGDGLLTNNQIHNSAEIYSDSTSELAGNDYRHDRRPDMFRCLSCFSFFIPTGNGFKIFRMFENKVQTNAVQDQQKPMRKSWISSIFASHKKPASESGSDIRLDALTTTTESRVPSSNVNGQSFSKQKDLSSTSEFKDPVESGIAESQEDGHYTGDNSKNAMKGDTARDNFEAVTSSQTSTSNVPIDVSTCNQTGRVKASADTIPAINGEFPEDVASVSPPDELKLLISSRGGSPNCEKSHSALIIENTDGGKDTVIVVEPETVCNADSQISQYLNVSEETECSTILNTHTVTEPRGADDRESYRIEIIKSIVYGGLLESMISLGVVSSAAGASTATLNILALALANLIGGLVLILHNLWDLKKYKMAEQISPYEEVLGCKENFSLHAIVVNLSFLMFGLIPPITYGFSFRKSDSRELKLLAAAAASLAGIFALAVGKAYVRKLPKSYLKTIAYYVVLGLMVSGISFAVGELINGLLEKLHFHTNSPDLLNFPLTKPAAVDWASY